MAFHLFRCGITDGVLTGMANGRAGGDAPVPLG
jgi:hypothetical protein